MKKMSFFVEEPVVVEKVGDVVVKVDYSSASKVIQFIGFDPK